jgi:C4-dicarboxylate transporter DctM subunit
MVPIVILGGIVSGVFTATESGAIAAVYALLVAVVIYRELRLRELPEVLLRSTLTTALVMIVISSAGAFSWILANENVPELTRKFLSQVAADRWVVLFIMLTIMLFIGCVMEIVSASIIMIPVMFPIARAYGFDDIHFGMLFMITMAVGAVTPPVGVTLYITLGIAGTSLSSVNKYIWPMCGILAVVLIICALCPPLITFIPELVLGK